MYLYCAALVQFWPKQRSLKTKNLMTGEEKEVLVPQPASPTPLLASASQQLTGAAPPPPVELVAYWKPNLTLALIDDQTHYSRAAIPPQLNARMFSAGAHARC